MKNKDLINILLNLLNEEAKRVKKGKKKKKVSAPIITRPLGSMFYMDAAVSLMEASLPIHSSLFKPTPKLFDHLKWSLTDLQKHFLQEFINTPDEALKSEDFQYASKHTGIPLENIKSIKNTYGKPEYGYAKEDVAKDSIFNGLKGGPTFKELGCELIGKTDIPFERLYPMNHNPHFRAQTPGETIYKAKYGKTGGLNKIYEHKLPDFMYEWLLYSITGEDTLKINESKLMNDLHSTKFDKNYKFIYFSFDVPIQESKAHPYDLASNNIKLNSLKEFLDKVDEFNKVFGTNFIIANQFTGDDGFIKVVLENAQLTDGKKVFNRKSSLDMAQTEEYRMKEFLKAQATIG